MPRRVLLVSSNGMGLGHVTRLLAVGRRLPAELAPVMLTLSRALPHVRALGVPAEHLWSAGWAGVAAHQWNALFAARLEEVLGVVAPAAVVFDGAHPYQALTHVAGHHPATPFVWLRRGRWRRGRAAVHDAADGVFRAVVEPGEVGAVRGVAPVVLHDRADLLPRAEALARLGLDPARRYGLVSLGTGAARELEAAVIAAVNGLQDVGLAPVVVRSILLPPVPPAAGAAAIRVYPLAPLLGAFDLVVSAAGYNAVHELLACGVPAVLVADPGTALDDQAARAEAAAATGAASVWDGTAATFTDAAAGLLDRAPAAPLAAAGATEVASLVAELARP